MTQSKYFAGKALRGLLADATSDEDIARARRFAELNGLDYPQAGAIGRRRSTARGRGTSAAELRRYLDRRSAA